MTDTRIHSLPPLLVAAATYAVDQPHIGTLEAALDAARTSLHMDDDAARELTRVKFIEREARLTIDGSAPHEMEHMTDSEHTAALVCYGDAGYLLGFATCWLMLQEKGGPR
jgi:hypothetical protein